MNHTPLAIVGHKTKIDLLVKLAEAGALGQGYVFFGPEMTGKKTIALALAEFLETNRFENTGRVLEDAILVESSEGRIGIDQIRELQGFLWKKPFISARRTVIIDNCHLLTPQSQNALLKIVEEPPKSSLIVFITADENILFPTLASRLHKLYFGPLAENQMKEFLGHEKIKDIGAILRGSHGLPGRVSRLLHNDKNKMLHELAVRLLMAGIAERKAMLKDYLAKDEADPMGLLAETIMISYSAEKKPCRFLREALVLRRNMAMFNLNPKLQIENLFLRGII